MNSCYDPLFTSWKIGNVEIKNRIVLCPMGGTSLFGWMQPNKFDEESAQFFLQRAKNNVGLVIPGIAPLRDTLGGKWLYKNKKMFKRLGEYMEEFHRTGSKLFVQLTAGFGRSFAITDPLVKLYNMKIVRSLIKPIIDLSYICASPSKLPSRWSDKVQCREVTKKEIEQMIYAFSQTAKLCKEAGVDGVEVHAVHEGYLLDQFTLPYTNQRTDEYGGSFENRYRFAVEVVKAIKKECGEDYPVSIRYSVVSKTKGFNEGAVDGEVYAEVGRTLEESEKAAKYLVDAGYDMLNCDNGTYDAWYWSHPPQYMPNNCNLEDAAHIKKFVDVPIVVAGKMEPEVASQAIKEGRIDAMGIARQFLVDPCWVTKLMNDKLDDIQPCINCHNACFAMAHYKGVANDEAFEDVKKMARCALNPVTMNGGKYIVKPAKVKKKVAIIGGGVGGMETARIARLRGHDVCIYEKSNKLGGVFIAAAAPDFKENDKKLLRWYIKQIKDLNIPVVFNKEIKDINELDADEIVVATGSTPRRLKVEGGEKAIDAIDYLLGSEVGNEVAIIGGGLSGCEIALDLYKKGKTPKIVEMKDDLIAVRGVCLANSSYLRDYFKAHNVEVHLNSKLNAIKNGYIVIEDKVGNQSRVTCDSVISSIGYNPSPLFKQSKHVHLVGDCRNVGNLRTVVWRAWEIAEKI